MRTLALAAVLVLLGAPLFAQESQTTFTPEEMEAARKSPQAFEIDPSRVRLKYIGPARIEQVRCEPAPSAAALPDLGTIINIGKEIWKIIEANRPVVDIRQSYATALPAGTTDWHQLSGWNPPVGDIYELEAGNLWGWTVIKVRFQVLRTWGGNYNGVGRYLTAVTTEPLLVDVFWGYRFSMDAEVPKESVINVGTPAAPMAGLTHTLKWRINTVVKEMRGAHVFYLQGDGMFRQIGSPLPPAPPLSMSKALSALQTPVLWD
jgi:hypothetical protein